MASLVTATDIEVDVVYNVYQFGKELFLCDAYVVSKDQDGYLAHIQQKALEGTIGAFQLALNATRRQTFRCIAEMQPEHLVKHFHQGRRKAPPLEKMLEDRDLFKAIQTYVHRRLDTILQLVVQHGLPLSYEVERRVLVKDFLVATQPEQTLAPSLFFRKTEQAVHYQLKLRYAGEPWPTQDRDLVALTNQPTGWVLADFQLFRLEHINGFLVKPFRQREEVIIPATSVQAYFRNFILRIARKVEIEAEGFAVEQFNTLEQCQLVPTQHLFDDQWLLAVRMVYHDKAFGWREERQNQLTLQMDETDIKILKVSRDGAAEAAFMKKLANFPLVQQENSSYFQLPDELQTHPYALVEWLSRQRQAFVAAGFQVELPTVEDKTLQLAVPSIQLSVDTESDWFDLKGDVVVGEYRFPFTKLAKYIREANRFYPLPDGTYFLIPEEWMERYQQIANFGKKEGENIRLTKSQYTLLAGIDLGKPLDLDAVETPAYAPSPLLKAQLRPYQLAGLQWLAKLHHQELGGCLADDMGLGKTLQTIAILLYAKEQRALARAEEREKNPPENKAAGTQIDLFAPADDEDFLQPLNALIVLPSSLLFNWESEIKKFVPSLSVYQHFGPKRQKDPRVLRRFDVILTTYQTALRDVEVLRSIEFEYIILDESQQIKNRESKVFKALNTLEAKHKLSLSGTPIENSLSDLWSQMQFINDGLLGNFNFFRKEFILPIERGQNEEKKDKLRQLVQPYLLRRTKEEVAKDLPPLSKRVFYTEMLPEQRKYYEREKSAARNYLLDNFSASDSKYRILVVQTLTKLRQLANHPVLINQEYTKGSGKFKDILEQWDTIRRAGHKVLLFSSFVKHLNLFREVLDERQAPYSWLSGDLTAKKRKAAIQRFQEDPAVQSFFISIKTGGTGLNLTAADYVFILDPWWNPTIEEQAIARAHRIGQKKNVFALKFITRDSIEEKILKLQERKLQLAEDIIGNNGKLALGKGEIAFLLS
ncbi:MAG: DEAD/DEAH box helicase [Bacteroidota bacterium]